MAKYRAREGYCINDKQAQILGEFIEEKFPNGVTAPELLEAARSPKAPVHSLFEWNDGKAAELYRLHQARDLIKGIYVKIDNVEVPAYQRVFVQSLNHYQYVDTKSAKADPELWEQVIKTALNEAKGWARRYRQYKQLKAIVVAIEKTERVVNEKVQKQSARAG